MTTSCTMRRRLSSAQHSYIRGGGGNDSLSGELDDDYMEGNAGMDDMYGGPGVDEMYGGTGDDFLRGGDDQDFLYGGEGDDALDGGADPDELYGEDGMDFLYDGDGIGGDYLDGGGDDDLLWSADGTVHGGDTLIGAAGSNDTYWAAGLDTVDGSTETVGAGVGPGNNFLATGDPFADYAKWPTPDADDFWHTNGWAGTRS